MTTLRPGFGQSWPADELETLAACQICGHERLAVAAEAVEDWSFRSAAGRWTYWRCAGCHALVLNPRPTADNISHAYASYYTHVDLERTGLQVELRTRLRNEAWAIGWGADLSPRLNLPRVISPLFRSLARRAYPGFVIACLAGLARGKLLDVGCGNGRYLDIAIQLGFDAQGIDPDPSAVAFVSQRGLRVSQGGFENLAEMPSDFDVVVASHVLEHAHDPVQALVNLLARVRAGGHLILALPNAQSPVFDAFGPHWRGLEAPRHIAIPARAHLTKLLTDRGCIVTPALINRAYTWDESVGIANSQRAAAPSATNPSNGEPDLIELLIQTPTHRIPL